MFLEAVAKNDDVVSVSELRWNSMFADIILEALRELKHDVGNINSQLSTGIYFSYNIFSFITF